MRAEVCSGGIYHASCRRVLTAQMTCLRSWQGQEVLIVTMPTFRRSSTWLRRISCSLLNAICVVTCRISDTNNTNLRGYEKVLNAMFWVRRLCNKRLRWSYIRDLAQTVSPTYPYSGPYVFEAWQRVKRFPGIVSRYPCRSINVAKSPRLYLEVSRRPKTAPRLFWVPLCTLASSSTVVQFAQTCSRARRVEFRLDKVSTFRFKVVKFR